MGVRDSRVLDVRAAVHRCSATGLKPAAFGPQFRLAATEPDEFDLRCGNHVCAGASHQHLGPKPGPSLVKTGLQGGEFEVQRRQSLLTDLVNA